MLAALSRIQRRSEERSRGHRGAKENVQWGELFQKWKRRRGAEGEREIGAGRRLLERSAVRAIECREEASKQGRKEGIVLDEVEELRRMQWSRSRGIRV